MRLKARNERVIRAATLAVAVSWNQASPSPYQASASVESLASSAPYAAWPRV